MAENLATMIQSVMDETHWPSEDTAILRHILAALMHYRRRRFYFSERKGTFPTKAGVSVYERSGVNYPQEDVFNPHYPADLMEIDNLRISSGIGETILERVGFDEMRERNSNSSSSPNSPSYYSWYGDKLYLSPTPAGVSTVTLDYLFDSTRDEATGLEITGKEPVSPSNEYFRRGAEMLRTRVIYSMSLGRTQDPTLAIAMKTLNSEAEQSLNFETHQRRYGSGLRVRPVF